MRSIETFQRISADVSPVKVAFDDDIYTHLLETVCLKE